MIYMIYQQNDKSERKNESGSKLNDNGLVTTTQTVRTEKGERQRRTVAKDAYYIIYIVRC